MKTCKGFELSVYFLLNLPADDPIGLARAAIAGGVSAIQLRGKEASAATLFEVAEALLPLAREHKVALLINDRLDVAMAVGADGVHLGRDDLPVEVARRLAPTMVIGASCYGSVERAAAMKAAGADYLAFGAVFASPTKPGAPVIELSVIRSAKPLGLPIVAIGGIGIVEIPALVEAGVDGVAVISAIQHTPDPSAATKRLKNAMKGTSDASRLTD